MSDYHRYELGDVVLQSGMTLRGVTLGYQTHGRLNSDESNAVLYPTRFCGRHEDNEFLIGRGMALDPETYFIVVPNLIGNGVSSSPNNTPPPFNKARFPHVTIYDNVAMQRRLLSEVFGIDRLCLAVGWSMGAQQAYHWAAIYPDAVERLAPICGSARTSRHNHVFLEGMKASLTADRAWMQGWYDSPPQTGLRAMGRGWAGWALSQAFYREELYRQLGFASVEDFLVGFWEDMFLKRDANNMLSLIWSWQNSDISANSLYEGDFESALGAIKAKTVVMPGETDLYFPPEDSAYEVDHIADAELRTIPSVWGHYAGGPANPEDVAFVNRALEQLLGN